MMVAKFVGLEIEFGAKGKCTIYDVGIFAVKASGLIQYPTSSRLRARSVE